VEAADLSVHLWIRRREQDQTAAINQGITTLMGKVMHKDAAVTSVLVEQVPAAGWSIGGEPVPVAAQVDTFISAGTNTPEQKARFIAEVNALLKSVVGSDLPTMTYVILHDVPKDSWGYGGLTQAHRANQRQAL
jgi:4-oxalocrotonate tautomerase